MPQPIISVIIPTYNSAATLESCLKSLKNQTYNFFEVLIIDGLSKDNTIAIASSYSNKLKNFRIISEKDKGIYDAMNKGIILAKGDWLYFLGSDDEIYSCSTFMEIEKYLKDKSEFIYGNIVVKGNNEWLSDGDIYDGYFDKFKLAKKNICHQAIFYKKTLFQRFGNYNLDYRLLADWDINLRFYAKINPQFVDIVIAKYNIVGSSYQSSASDPFHSYRPISIFNNYKYSILSKYYTENQLDLHILSRYFHNKNMWWKYFLTLVKIQFIKYSNA